MRSALFLSLAATVLAATPAEWRSQSIYFLLTDRFARTDNSTTAECDTSAVKYCGGTWQGIINQLDYIQGMGFTAIWITPVTANLEDGQHGEAYHGYWQQDIYALNPHFGSQDDLRALSDALHDRGMYLMVDVVANHFGYDAPAASVDYSVFNPFNSADYFHTPCDITDYDNQTQVEECWLYTDAVSLPDVDTTNEEVKEIWYDWVGDLVSNYSIDGLRIDTARHVQKDFWRDYNDAAGVYCVGEVFQGDPDYTCGYQEVMDGVLNYPIYYPLLNAFSSTFGSLNDLANMIETVKYTCSDATLLGNFIENHDNPRFASYTDDISLAKNVAAFVILSDGIPIIYAGQEQHYSGAGDPANREATWLSGYDTTSELYQFIAKTNQIRNHAIWQNETYLSYKNYAIYNENNVLAMRKGFDGSQIITILTNAGANAGSSTVSVPNTGYTAGAAVTEIYTCEDITVSDSGEVSVPMESGLPRVLYPKAKLEGSGICNL
ncbi:alpha-amylase [Aspergillus foveolatus]|uniref:alpha-amylase n=1 Tax=Aspergillus foveolatus TaxID=210207 RepID=UPI003CCCBA0D